MLLTVSIFLHARWYNFWCTALYIQNYVLFVDFMKQQEERLFIVQIVSLLVLFLALIMGAGEDVWKRWQLISDLPGLHHRQVLNTSRKRIRYTRSCGSRSGQTTHVFMWAKVRADNDTRDHVGQGQDRQPIKLSLVILHHTRMCYHAVHSYDVSVMSACT